MKQAAALGLSEEGFHRIAYREWGEPSRAQPPIICVHGLTRNGRDFDALAAYLEQRGRHVFCPDIVGRGDSDWLKDPLHYTYEQYISDMNAMIARMNAPQIDWIGTSLGGLLGMLLASLPNSPIRRLILNDVGPQIPFAGLARLSTYIAKEPAFKSIEEAKQYYQTIYRNFGPLTDAQWQTLTENSIKEIEPGRFISKMDHGIKLSPAKSQIAWRMLLHPYKALEGTFFDVDLWDIWRKVTCPVYVIHGINSDILLPSTIQKMQAIHPQTMVHHVPDTGHAPVLLEAADHEMINQWLMQDTQKDIRSHAS